MIKPFKYCNLAQICAQIIYFVVEVMEQLGQEHFH